jgi:hypothetical protein
VAGDGTVPMLRYQAPRLERAVQAACDELQAEVAASASVRAAVAVEGHTRLVAAPAQTRQVPLGDWLGRHRVPARLAAEPVTVLRADDGAGLACVPGLAAARWADPALVQGDDAALLLAVLEAFSRPTTVAVALGGLRKAARVDADAGREAVEHLVAGRFLRPTTG